MIRNLTIIIKELFYAQNQGTPWGTLILGIKSSFSTSLSRQFAGLKNQSIYDDCHSDFLIMKPLIRKDHLFKLIRIH